MVGFNTKHILTYDKITKQIQTKLRFCEVLHTLKHYRHKQVRQVIKHMLSITL